MSNSKRGISMTFAVCVAVISVMLGVYFANYWQAKKDKDFVNNFNGTLLSQPREVSEFNFISTDSLPFTNKNLIGQWSLMFFGFTNCPEMCPTTMSALSKMYKALEASKAPKPNVVMVSIDPARDTLKKLKTYVTSFDKHFIGARASEDRVNALTTELGVVHMKEQGKSDAEYNIQHSGVIMIFNPQGHLAGFFSLPHQPEKMATNFVRLATSTFGTA